jgi:chorismate lyase/3-hydroxybenzoate synthase
MEWKLFPASSSHMSHTSLTVELISTADLTAKLQQDDILMAVNFSDETKIDLEEPRLIFVGLNGLGNSGSIEIWRGYGKVTCHQKGRISYCHNNDFLFGHLLIDEMDSNKLDVLVEDAYKEINKFVQSTSFPHIFRFWNYIPSINKVENGIERYKAFCVGRHKATNLYSDFERSLPAASAVGTDVPGLLISFASGKAESDQVENPRQVSAFHYPSVYGPRSPLFSRAVYVNWTDNEKYGLYMSGTASIVGHETQHVGDISAQAEEAYKNIEALLDNFARKLKKANRESISGTSLRVYLRHPEQLEIVQNMLSKKPDLPENIIYLKADICRKELLLEIEGAFRYSPNCDY